MFSLEDITLKDINFFRAVIALLTLFVNAILTIFVYRGSQKVSRVQFSRSIQESWADIDELIKSDDDMFEISNILARGGYPLFMEEKDRKKAILTYKYLNHFSTIYFGIQNGFVPRGTLPSLTKALGDLMKNDYVLELVEVGVFDIKFVKLCRKLRKKVERESARESSWDKFLLYRIDQYLLQQIDPRDKWTR